MARWGSPSSTDATYLSPRRTGLNSPTLSAWPTSKTTNPPRRLPIIAAEGPHFATYRIMGALALDLADYIRSLGHHAQVLDPLAATVVFIPIFVEAGLGQLGANGQLLSPHFGSRARLMMISTDAQLTYDQPVDYGINAFCSVCQVCVNRCPGRALLREKIWWRGAEKPKVIYERCLPVMARYESCGACMKVCPIQRYGMKPVMDHYAATGQVLGKGTHLLEGYSLRGRGYFGPGELPSFDNNFFQFPHGKSEDLLFDELKEKIKAGEVPDDESGDATLHDFKKNVEKYVKLSQGSCRPFQTHPVVQVNGERVGASDLGQHRSDWSPRVGRACSTLRTQQVRVGIDMGILEQYTSMGNCPVKNAFAH